MSKQHTVWSVIFALVILAALWFIPAQAQDIGGTTSSTLYLPQIERNFALWFTDDELTQAQRDAGYDPEIASMHTICTLDASATPPDDVRYSSCEQYYVDGVPTEGTQHFIWWLRLNDGKVHGVEVGGTMVQSASTDAPCYVDDDQEVSCG